MLYIRKYNEERAHPFKWTYIGWRTRLVTKALIGAQAGILHFGDDAAGLLPGLRLVAEGYEEARFFSRLLVLALRLFQKRGGLGQEPAVW